MNTPSPLILSSVLAHVQHKRLEAIQQGAHSWRISRLDFHGKEIHSELKRVNDSLEKINHHLKGIDDNLKG